LRDELTNDELTNIEASMKQPDLSLYDNSWYSSGRSRIVEALWFFIGLPILRCRLLPSSLVRSAILRLFGATIAQKVVLKPGVRVKFPWLLSIGGSSWIGEDVWIDNLVLVTVGANVCISQGAYLCTGNHDWSDPAFGLRVQSIVLEDGSWVGARAVVCPGVTIEECGIAAAGSVVTNNIPAYEIHAGNPARLLRRRKFNSHKCSAIEATSDPPASQLMPN
jgi:putative colanic acid biosynthesis acetyltransferase WcaF